MLLDTVSAPPDLAPYAEMLDTDGVMVLLGVPEKPATLPAFAIIPNRRSIVGSLIGGIKETQEMLDFSAANGITADVETIPVQDIEVAYQWMLKARALPLRRGRIEPSANLIPARTYLLDLGMRSPPFHRD
jgi:uncharacterized zinc-type alcohol dehydrogenase-like protein